MFLQQTRSQKFTFTTNRGVHASELLAAAAVSVLHYRSNRRQQLKHAYLCDEVASPENAYCALGLCTKRPGAEPQLPPLQHQAAVT